MGLANATPTQISSDPYGNGDSFHATEVEPDTFSNGSTLMAAFQVVENFDTAGQTAVLGAKIGDALRSRVSKPSQTFALLTLVDQALPSRSKPGLQRLVGLR